MNLRQILVRIPKALRIAVFAFALATSFMHPEPAQAQYVVSDPGNLGAEIAQWAKEAAQWVKQAAQWAWEQANALLQREDADANADKIANAVQLNAEQNKTVLEGTTQANMDNTKQTADTQVAAQNMGKSVVSANSKMCEMVAAGQAGQGAGNVVSGTTAGAIAYLQSKGIGSTDPRGNALAYAREICGRSGANWTFVSVEKNGKLGAKLTCPGVPANTNTDDSSNPYVDADTTPAAVTNYEQYPIPANITVDVNHYYRFGTVTPASSTPYQDPVRFIAAWKYCEHIQANLPSPAYSSADKAPSFEDVYRMYEELRSESTSSTGPSECMRLVAWRMACPTTAAVTPNGGGGSNCNTQQVTLCHMIKNLGITGIGDPEADNALSSCDSNGLSRLMAMKILAYSHYDFTVLSNFSASTGGSSKDVESEFKRAPDAETQFNNFLEGQKKSLTVAIGVTVEEQINSRMREQNAQMEEQNKMLAEQNRLMAEHNKLLSEAIAKNRPIFAEGQ